MKKTTRKPRRQEIVKTDCFFCKEGKSPSFLEYEILSRYTSERGKILSRTRTGICGKHQRKLTGEIKKARFMAFLPFVVRPE